MNVHLKKTSRYFFSFIMLSLSYNLFASTTVPVWKPCRVDGMVGEQPAQYCRVIDYLKAMDAVGEVKNESEGKIKIEETDNRLLLHGDPGTGKTHGVHCIAKETKRNLIEISASK